MTVGGLDSLDQFQHQLLHTIKMGRYPTSPNVIKPAQLRSQFEDWKVKSHPVTSGDLDANPDIVTVQGGTGQQFWWYRMSGSQQYDQFGEENLTYASWIWDDVNPANDDAVELQSGSPSQPTSPIDSAAYDGIGDDGVIDVEILAP